MKTKSITNIFVYIILILAAIIAIFPIIYVIASSFKTNSELFVRPEAVFSATPTFDNFIIAWNSEQFNLSRMLMNSILYTLASVAITLITSTMAGYVFARGKFKLKNQIFAVFVSLMFINVGSITIYPQFEVLNLFKLNKGLPALLVMHFFTIATANIFLVRNFVTSIPQELDEAARIDGCGFFGIFWRVIAPLLKPLFATLGILAFQASWNDYLMPNIFTLTVPNQRTLIVGIIALKNTGEGASNWALMFAASTMALLPVLIAYLCANKYFVSGLSEGAVKG